MNTLRDKLQTKFADIWLAKRHGILYLTPRFGKIYTSINILEKLGDIEVLIAYPDIKIKRSWQDDFETRGYNDAKVTYTTHMSLKKHVDKKFGLVIIDEVHLLSPAQRIQCERLFMLNRDVLALTGTLMNKTKKILSDELDLLVVGQYSLAEGIRDKIIPDYRIKIEYVPLDDTIKGAHKNKDKTDKAHVRGLSWVIAKFDREGKNANFLRMARMRALQGSVSKLKRTVELLNEDPLKRILVFCGSIKVAESLDIPCHHGKSKDKELFQDFVDGVVTKMAVVQIGGSGVTYKKLNKIIINSFDSNAERLSQKINRAMSMEYDNPDKRAEILILTSDNKVELNWLSKSLEFFDTNKIEYVRKKAKFIACDEHSQIHNYQRTNRKSGYKAKGPHFIPNILKKKKK